MTRCERPVAFEHLVALWVGDLPEDEADRIEAHLFECEPCARASDRLGQLVGSLREVIPPVVSHAQRERLRASGVRLLETPVIAGERAHARFAPEIDLMVHVLRGDLSRAERVDVELVTPHGATRVALEGVPFDAAAGEVLIACQRHYELMFADGSDPIFRVFSVVGERREPIGDYLVEHEWR